VYIKDFHLTKVISVFNGKGGSGKTSVAGSLAYALSEKNRKILLIDGSKNMNLTHSYGLKENEKNLGAAILNEENLENYIIKTRYSNIDMIVSDHMINILEMTLFCRMHRENIFKNILNSIIRNGVYDEIIIDTSSTIGIVNLNLLNATNFCIIPITLDSFGVENINTQLDFIKGVQKYNKKLKNVKILINMYDTRYKTITSKCESYVRENFSDLLFSTIITVDINIQKAQSNNVPVLVYEENSRISKEYRKLCKEIIKLNK